MTHPVRYRSMSTPNRPPVVHLFPRGTCAAPAFYFRGAEPLTEPEHLQKVLATARSEKRSAKRRLDAERGKHDKLSQQLSKKDDYTVALASALGEESYATEEHARLRHELTDLTTKISKCEQDIEFFKDRQNTTLLSGLRKERAYYHAEIENLRITVLQGIDSIRDGKAMIANIVCSQAYKGALQKAAEHDAVRDLRGHLRGKLKKLFWQFNIAKPPKNFSRIKQGEAAELAEMLDQKHAIRSDIDELEHERFYTESIARNRALAMIGQIERMNLALVALGGEPIDCTELRSHFTPSQRPTPTRTRDERDGGAKTRPMSRTSRRTKGGLPSARRPATTIGARRQ